MFTCTTTVNKNEKNTGQMGSSGIIVLGSIPDPAMKVESEIVQRIGGTDAIYMVGKIVFRLTATVHGLELCVK